MAKFEFKLPDIGEGVAEGEIVNWLVNPGDEVAENQEMVEVMTDKATVTIGAPKAGKVAELKFKVGDTVPVGGVLVVFDVGGADAPAPAPAAKEAPPPAPAPAPKTAAPSSSGPVASAVGDIRETLPACRRRSRKTAIITRTARSRRPPLASSRANSGSISGASSRVALLAA